MIFLSKKGFHIQKNKYHAKINSDKSWKSTKVKSFNIEFYKLKILISDFKQNDEISQK